MRSLMIVLMGATLAGCASMSSQPTSIEDRVLAKWQALVAGDYEMAYSYYSPGYRSTVTPEDFARVMSRRTIPFKGVSVRDFGPCEETVCAARVAVTYRLTPRVPGAKPFDSSKIIHEDWIMSGGDWFFVPKQ